MPLSDTQCEHAKPGEKNTRLYEVQGLDLEVRKSGSKLWRVNYRMDGKKERLALDAYPMVSL